MGRKKYEKEKKIERKVSSGNISIKYIKFILLYSQVESKDAKKKKKEMTQVLL